MKKGGKKYKKIYNTTKDKNYTTTSSNKLERRHNREKINGISSLTDHLGHPRWWWVSSIPRPHWVGRGRPHSTPSLTVGDN